MGDLLIVNFGGPRDLDEIGAFLSELLLDRDVVRTHFPSFFHDWLFRRVAKKRALKISEDYERIGGGSPIFSDTENLAQKLGALTFHRYLPNTHEESLRHIEASHASEILVLPLFPQFTYATTGSIARFFASHLSKETIKKLKWIKSYPSHPSFVVSFQRRIQEFLAAHNLKKEETILLFSAHGLPKQFIETGDPYQAECELSYQAILKAFPNALGRLSYQSKFGRGEWIRPYTVDVSENIRKWHQGRDNVIFIPLTFTSDHIETLFEIEFQYLPLIRQQKLNAYRCPALNLEPYWIEALQRLIQEPISLSSTQSLIRGR